MVRLSKDQTGEAEGHAGDRHLCQQHRLRQDRCRGRGNEADMIGRVVDAPCVAGPISDEGGNQARDERGIFHATDSQDFQREYPTGQRRPEDGPEARRDTGHEQHADARRIEAEQARRRTGKTSAELHGGPLAPGRPAEQVGHDCTEEHQRRHAERDTATGLVDLLDDQVVARFDGPARQMVEQSDTGPTKRQQEEKPRMIEARAGCEIKAP